MKRTEPYHDFFQCIKSGDQNKTHSSYKLTMWQESPARSGYDMNNTTWKSGNFGSAYHHSGLQFLCYQKPKTHDEADKYMLLLLEIINLLDIKTIEKPDQDHAWQPNLLNLELTYIVRYGNEKISIGNYTFESGSEYCKKLLSLGAEIETTLRYIPDDQNDSKGRYLNIFDGNANKREFTPLHLAVIAEQYEMIATLVAIGANINAEVGNSGWTCLHLTHHEYIAQKLIEEGADLNAALNEDYHYKSVVYGATSFNKSDQINKQTPLHIMVDENQDKIVAVLLHANATCDSRDSYENTPLIVAMGKTSQNLGLDDKPNSAALRIIGMLFFCRS